MNLKPSRNARAPLLALLLIAQACAPRNGTPDSAPASGSLHYTGVVSVSGSEGSVITSLNVSGRRPVILVGDLVSELRALFGARVAVTGSAASGAPGNAINVASYTVEQINGQKPYVGILVRTNDGYGLQEEQRLIPFDQMPMSLNDKIGFKIWVIGVIQRGRLLVQSYGVIRGN